MPSETSKVFVLVDGNSGAAELLRFAQCLALKLDVPWEAVHVQTPIAEGQAASLKTGEALKMASSLGASVASIPGARVSDAILDHVRHSENRHIVLPVRTRTFWARLTRPSLIERLAQRDPAIRFHALPGLPQAKSRSGVGNRPSAASYLASVLAVVLTAALAALLYHLTDSTNLSILFLFPVITASARLGLRPAIAAAVLSTLSYNFLFLQPLYAFVPWAPQSWIMGAGLLAVAIYTALLTSTLRRRVALSDRSAQESADLASFAQSLTRVADWESTARAVCKQVSAMFGIRAQIIREVDGQLQMIASQPEGATLDPVDTVALDWAWRVGEPTGRGKDVLGDANWQFVPLRTSLGSLAVLAVARADGRDPVAPERSVLFATVVAQAALAHERLHLEALRRAAN